MKVAIQFVNIPTSESLETYTQGKLENLEKNTKTLLMLLYFLKEKIHLKN